MTEPTSPELPSPNPLRPALSLRRRVLLFGGAVGVLLAGWGIVSLFLPFSAEARPRVQAPDSGNAPVDDGEPETAETSTSVRPEQVQGHWVLNDSIRREVQIRPDGTASMNVQLDYLSSLIYGREMDLELTWKLEDDVLSHSVVSGTPVKNVERLTKDFGDSASYRVVRVSDQELVLETLSEQPHRYHWVSGQSKK